MNYKAHFAMKLSILLASVFLVITPLSAAARGVITSKGQTEVYGIPKNTVVVAGGSCGAGQVMSAGVCVTDAGVQQSNKPVYDSSFSAGTFSNNNIPSVGGGGGGIYNNGGLYNRGSIDNNRIDREINRNDGVRAEERRLPAANREAHSNTTVIHHSNTHVEHRR